jgi:hypothetical protein
MRTATNSRARRSIAALAFGLVLVMAHAAGAATEPVPHVATASAAHETATSGELRGSVTPHGIATISFFCEYGPTAALGSSTKPVAVPLPTPPQTVVPVGQTVTGLHIGDLYRIAATYTTKAGIVKTIHARDEKTFTGGKAGVLRFIISKEREERVTVTYGGDALLTGSLTGAGSGGRSLTLQATPYPFTEAFAPIGTPVVTSAAGGFSVVVDHLTHNTEFRFLTDGLRPLYSPTVLVTVTPRITLHVRGSSRTGLYRLYGTVTPARKGAPVAIQELLPQKAGSKRSGPRTHPVGSGVLKRGPSGSSRFSIIVKLTGSSRYRAYVRLAPGALSSGSSGSVLLRGPKATAKHTK